MSKLDNDELLNVSGGLKHYSFSKTFHLTSKELEMLFEKGYIDKNGCILKNNLKKAEEFLQESGWNGVLCSKGKNFDELPDIIDLSGKDTF